jgi:hypothetical protein
LNRQKASLAAKLPLHGATIAPAISDGDYDCRIYEQVDGECYVQCIAELGFTAWRHLTLAGEPRRRPGR